MIASPRTFKTSASKSILSPWKLKQSFSPNNWNVSEISSKQQELFAKVKSWKNSKGLHGIFIAVNKNLRAELIVKHKKSDIKRNKTYLSLTKKDQRTVKHGNLWIGQIRRSWITNFSCWNYCYYLSKEKDSSWLKSYILKRVTERNLLKTDSLRRIKM